MRSVARSASTLVVTALLLGALLPTALAHGGPEGAMDMGGGTNSSADEPLPEDQYPPSYFSHPEHRGLLFAHIALEVLSWVFMLPLGEWGLETSGKRSLARCWMDCADMKR